MVNITDDGKGYIHFDLAIPGDNKEVSYTASGKFPVEEGTFYATVGTPFTPDDPIDDQIAFLLCSDLLPSPSNRLAQDPLEEICLIHYCDQHPLAHETIFPLALPCINNKSLPQLWAPLLPSRTSGITIMVICFTTSVASPFLTMSCLPSTPCWIAYSYHGGH